MKTFFETFNWKAFLIALIVCIIVAGAGSLVTGLSFWLLLVIATGALLINGFIAEIEDRRDREKSKKY
ncbi:MAG: hypothetical protein WCD07_00685 [Burkholderiales bacterium]